MPDGPRVTLGTVNSLVGITVGCVPREQSDGMIDVEVESPGQVRVTGHCHPGVWVRLQEIVGTL